MLRIQNNSTDVFIVTLRDKTSNQVNPYYTWKVINKQTLDETVFYTDNFTTSPYYDSFTISISNTQSGLTAGILNIGHGQFTYEVYEMTNQYDLNLANAIQMVETGILIVNPTYSVNPTSTTDTNIPVPINSNLDRI